MSRLQVIQPGPGYFARPMQPQQDPWVLNKMASEREAARDARAAGMQAARDERQTAQASYLSAQNAAQQGYLAQLADQRRGELANQEAFHQANRDYRMAGIDQQRALQHADLQSQLDSIQLGHREQQRLEQMRQAIDGVNADPNLAPEEKQNLITQLRSGINPLENRQRQAQMLETTIRSRAMEQTTQQQATLFNQHQASIARGIAGNIQYAEVTGPDGRTYRQPFYVDSTGKPLELNFPMMQQQHEMEMARGRLNLAQTAQGMNQSAELHPHRVALARLSTDELAQQINFRAQMQPWQVLNLEGEVRNRREQLFAAQQQYRHREQMMPLELQREMATLDAMDQSLRASRDAQGRANALFPGQLVGQELNNQASQATLDFHRQPLSSRIRTVYDPEEVQRITDQVDADIRAERLDPWQTTPARRQQIIEERLRAGGNGIRMFEHAPGQFRVEPSLNEGLNTNQERIARGHVMGQLNNDLRQFRSGPIRNPDGTTTPRERPHWLDPTLLTGDLAAEHRRNADRGVTELTPAMVRQLMDSEVERQVSPLTRRRGGQPAPVPAPAGGGPPPNPAAAAAAAENAVVRPPGARPAGAPARQMSWWEYLTYPRH